MEKLFCVCRVIEFVQINRSKKDLEPIKFQVFSRKLSGNPGVAVALCLLMLSELLVIIVAVGKGGYDWKTARELYPGIRYVRAELSIPRKMVINCLQIDSYTPGLMFYTTSRRSEWVEGKAETNRQTTRNFIR